MCSNGCTSPDRSRSARSPGSGLGLAIVRELVEAMGGRVTAAPDTGRGSRMVVVLPTPRRG